MQIGAFDGVSGDAIFPLINTHELRGVLVETHKQAYERLVRNYQPYMLQRFQCVNAAIDEKNGKRTLYKVRPLGKAPEWTAQLASFGSVLLKKNVRATPGLRGEIETEDVRCLTFDALFEETGYSHFGVLQIDAEGYDAELLRLYDVERRKPASIRFEHNALPRSTYESTLRSLFALGYRVHADRSDTLAYRPV